MKTMILAAFAALSLTAAVQAAQPGNYAAQNSASHQGGYDNTGKGPGETGLEGGGG